MIKYAGDIILLTVQGVFPLAKALVSSQVNPDVALTDKISQAFTEVSNLHKTKFGWNMTFYPQGNQIFINVPIAEGSNQEQYVMNTITNSWWRFTNIDANVWAISNEKIYYGGNGVVALYGTVRADNSLDIATKLKQSFTYLKERGRLKHVKAVRPNFLTSGTPAISMGIAVDFGSEAPLNPLSFTAFTGGVWDTGLWDTAVWGGDVSPLNDWQTVYAVGTALAISMETVSNGVDVRYASADYLYEYGGIIA